ncbi:MULTISPECIES: TonB-dependent receptor domain-containing protein [Pacificimonas]|nr:MULTISPECIES: TonB-dependent receptor [Pacificimonas]MBZ6379584.1 TonB-dependent receptor [Pacificimonas aurantium]
MAMVEAAPAHAQEETYNFNIPQQDLESVLRQFAAESGQQVTFDAAVVRGLQAPPLEGDFTAREALDYLLAESGLRARKGRSGLFIVQSATTQGAAEGYRTVPTRTAGATSAAANVIIVTAQKRGEALEDVPASISVLTNREIEGRNIVGMEDYLSTVPGVSFVGTGPSLNQIIIRGVGTTLYEQATTSSYFGEVPLTDSISGSGEVGGTTSDLKLVDVERVEVLKGPQGTLFGAGSIGGVVRTIPVAPRLNEVSGSLKAGYGLLDRSDEDDTTLEAVLNLPLVDDRLALRVVGYRMERGGYVERVSTPELEAESARTGLPVDLGQDLGDLLYVGGRAALLWQATDRLSVTVTAATQTLEEDGPAVVDLDLGGYQSQQLRTPGAEELSESEFWFVNAVGEYDFDWMSATASYTHIDEEKVRQEYSEYSSLGALLGFSADKQGDIFELRFASNLEGPLQFVTGVYYEEFSRRQDQVAEWGGLETETPFGLPILDSSPGPNGLPVIWRYPINKFETLDQKAVFGEVSYEIIPALTLTGGARWFKYNRDLLSLGNEFFSVAEVTQSGTKKDGTTFKASLSYEPTEDSLLYAKWATGFRLGGSQLVPPASVCDVDNDGNLDFTNAPLRDGYDSDEVDSYEIGGKLNLNSRARVSAAVYRNDWNGIPVLVSDTSDTCPGFQSVTANAGGARTQGVEVETTIDLAAALQLSGAFSYTDTEFLDDGIGQEGDRLPLSPEFTYSLGLLYDFTLGAHDAYVRADYSYVDGFKTNATDTYPRVQSRSLVSMRASVDLDPLTVSLYVQNLLNDDALVAPDNTLIGRRLRPRVIGAELAYRF